MLCGRGNPKGSRMAARHDWDGIHPAAKDEEGRQGGGEERGLGTGRILLGRRRREDGRLSPARGSDPLAGSSLPPTPTPTP